jgi:hypothetical protein
MRDILLLLSRYEWSTNGRDDFAAEALLATLAIAHDAVAGGNDGNTETRHRARQFLDAAIHTATGARNALEVMDEHFTTWAVLEVDADEALTAVGDELEAADVALFDEDSRDSVIELIV